MLNVLTGAAISRLITPTTIVESRPPLRKAPSGTSLISRFSTARVTRSRTPAVAAGVDAPVGVDRHARAGRDLEDARIEGARARHVAVDEVVRHGRGIHLDP